MGNSIAKKADIPKDFSATAGHAQLWKIWHGKTKEKDGAKDISVWVFDKGELSKRQPIPVTDKALQEQLYQIMRKDLVSLKECKNPNIVDIQEVVEDSKSAIVFITERIVCSLADILSRFHGIPLRAYEGYLESNGTLSELEISKGLLSLAEGLQYLHSVSRKLSLSVSPENVVVTASGQWKLCGFGLSIAFQGTDQQLAASPYFLKPMNTALRVEPDLCYTSPEATIGGCNPQSVRYLSPASDVFSLSLLAYDVYKFNLRVAVDGRLFIPTLNVSSNSADHHASAMESLRSVDFSFVPPGLAQVLASALHPDPRHRMTASAISGNPFFAAGPLAVLRTVTSLQSRDVGTQSSILASLPSQLGDFPPRILQNTVLRSLCKLAEAQPTLWTYTLPSHEYIRSRIIPGDYQFIAASSVAVGLAEKKDAESMQTFLKYFSFLQDSFDSKFFVDHFVNVLACNVLDSQHNHLKILCFQVLSEERVLLALDPACVVEKLAPRTCKETCKNPDARIKIHGLYFLAQLYGKIDQSFLVASVLPSLKHILEHEKDALVSMCVLGNYFNMGDNTGPDHIGAAILPGVVPLLADRSLSRPQFEQVLVIVNSLISKLLRARSADLGIQPVAALTGDDRNPPGFDAFGAVRGMIIPLPSPSQGTQGMPQGTGNFYPGTPAYSPASPSLYPPPSARAPALPYNIGGMSNAPMSLSSVHSSSSYGIGGSGLADPPTVSGYNNSAAFPLTYGDPSSYPNLNPNNHMSTSAGPPALPFSPPPPVPSTPAPPVPSVSTPAVSTSALLSPQNHFSAESSLVPFAVSEITPAYEPFSMDSFGVGNTNNNRSSTSGTMTSSTASTATTGKTSNTASSSGGMDDFFAAIAQGKSGSSKKASTADVAQQSRHSLVKVGNTSSRAPTASFSGMSLLDSPVMVSEIAPQGQAQVQQPPPSGYPVTSPSMGYGHQSSGAAGAGFGAPDFGFSQQQPQYQYSSQQQQSYTQPSSQYSSSQFPVQMQYQQPQPQSQHAMSQFYSSVNSRPAGISYTPPTAPDHSGMQSHYMQQQPQMQSSGAGYGYAGPSSVPSTFGSASAAGFPHQAMSDTPQLQQHQRGAAPGAPGPFDFLS